MHSPTVASLEAIRAAVQAYDTRLNELRITPTAKDYLALYAIVMTMGPMERQETIAGIRRPRRSWVAQARHRPVRWLRWRP